jgi:serpin B
MTRLTIAMLSLTVFGGTMAAADAPGKNQAAQGNNAFAFDLYAKLAPGQGNLFYSPLSISTALAMTASGARGETAADMAKVLHLPEDAVQAHDAMGALLRELTAADKPRPFQLHIANALWGQRGLNFLPAFLQLVRTRYGADLRETDFRDPVTACKVINAWVEAQTQRKIKDLLNPSAVDASTRLVLTNAIYFKSSWLHQFREQATKEEDFHVTPDQSARVRMMHQSENYRYGEHGGVQVLELPYAGGELAMYVLLPAKVDGLASLEATMTAESLGGLVTKLTPHQVDVAFPKFKVESEFSLKKTLSALGMARAFSNEADFSGMTGTPELQIADVVHKAYVNVDERGTEAAAATATIMRAMAALPREPVSFRADHPFLFVIRERHSGSILFQGRVLNPKS